MGTSRDDRGNNAVINRDGWGTEQIYVDLKQIVSYVSQTDLIIHLN